MSAGLIVWNADGTIQFDTSNVLARYLFGFTTGIVDGSIPIGNIDGDAQPLIMSATFSRATPTIYISGGNVVWSFSSIPSQYRANCEVIVVVK